jgi:hypothetical protein
MDLQVNERAQYDNQTANHTQMRQSQRNLFSKQSGISWKIKTY